jgi:hypothetical protein
MAFADIAVLLSRDVFSRPWYCETELKSCLLEGVSCILASKMPRLHYIDTCGAIVIATRYARFLRHANDSHFLLDSHPLRQLICRIENVCRPYSRTACGS